MWARLSLHLRDSASHRGELLISPLSTFISRSIFNRSSLLASLEAVHTAGVQHSDFRLENVAISNTGAVKLLDFSHSVLHDCKRTKCSEIQAARQSLLL